MPWRERLTKKEPRHLITVAIPLSVHDWLRKESKALELPVGNITAAILEDAYLESRPKAPFRHRTSLEPEQPRGHA